MHQCFGTIVRAVRKSMIYLAGMAQGKTRQVDHADFAAFCHHVFLSWFHFHERSSMQESTRGGATNSTS
jgi:hypothetical protein